jgi:hypothetical protein
MGQGNEGHNQLGTVVEMAVQAGTIGQVIVPPAAPQPPVPRQLPGQVRDALTAEHVETQRSPFCGKHPPGHGDVKAGGPSARATGERDNWKASDVGYRGLRR